MLTRLFRLKSLGQKSVPTKQNKATIKHIFGNHHNLGSQTTHGAQGMNRFLFQKFLLSLFQ
jgi:hypothetical protein